MLKVGHFRINKWLYVNTLTNCWLSLESNL